MFGFVPFELLRLVVFGLLRGGGGGGVVLGFVGVGWVGGLFVCSLPLYVAGGVVVLVCGFIVLEPDSHLLLLLLLLLLSSFETAVCAHASRCFFFAQRQRDRVV